MQTRTESLIETLLNIGSGFVIAYSLMQFVVTPLFELHTQASDNFTITVLFTAVSITRSYLWRRFFAQGLHRALRQHLTR